MIVEHSESEAEFRVDFIHPKEQFPPGDPRLSFDERYLFERFIGRKPRMSDNSTMLSLTEDAIKGVKPWTEIEHEMMHNDVFIQRIVNLAQTPDTRAEALDILYKGVLDRNVDFDGAYVYLMQLNEGRPVQEIIDEVSMSEEGRQRTLRSLYLEILHREPDEEGINVYGNQLSNGRSIHDIAFELRNSNERNTGKSSALIALELQQISEGRLTPFVNTPWNLRLRGAVDQLNNNAEERLNHERMKLRHELDKLAKDIERNHNKFPPGDPRNSFERGHLHYRFFESQHYVDVDDLAINRILKPALKGEKPWTEITQDLATSDIFSDRIGELASIYGAELAVDALYEGILDREADEEGRNIYKDQLRSGRNPREIVAELMNSEEGKSRTIRSLYLEILDREPDDEGMRIYGDQLVNGRSLHEIAIDLRTSDEYYGHRLPWPSYRMYDRLGGIVFNRRRSGVVVQTIGNQMMLNLAETIHTPFVLAEKAAEEVNRKIELAKSKLPWNKPSDEPHRDGE